MIDNMGRIVAQGTAALRYNARMKNLWAPWRMTYLQSNRESSAGAFEGCIFCDALRNPDDRASLIVHRGNACFVILNLYPYNNGHLMVVPHAHVSTIEDVPAEAAAEMMTLAQTAVGVLRVMYGPHGFNLGINLGASAGAGIASHVHLHVVPRWSGDTNFMTVTGETRVIPEDLGETWARMQATWPKPAG